MENPSHSHINKERTLSELKVDIDKLKPNSYKLVFRICECCKKEELKKYQAVNVFHQYKCLNCSNKINANINKEIRNAKVAEYWRKNGHPRQGVKHTEEAKRKIVENRTPRIYTEENRIRDSAKFSGEGNPFFGRRHSKESLAKMSESQSKIARKGKDSNLYGKSYYSKHKLYTDRLGRVFKLKSSWEEKIARYLDENQISWDYEKTAFPITYKYEGVIKEGTYIPDFFLKDEIWEVKGYFRKDAEIKFKTFKENYPNIKIKLLQKKELQEMGIKL